MEVQSMLSEKGKKLLVVNNFKFCVANMLKNKTVRWRCVSKNSKCPAKLYTPVDDFIVILRSNLSHNHHVEENLQWQVLNNSKKAKLSLPLYQTIKINSIKTPFKLLVF